MDIYEIYKKTERLLCNSLINIVSKACAKSTLNQPPKKILLIKLFGFGNFILLSPLMNILKNHNMEVHVLTTQQNENIVKAYSDLISKSHIVRYNKMWQLPINSLLLLKKIRDEKYDVTVDLEHVICFTSVLSVFSNSKNIFGFKMPNNPKYKICDQFVINNDDKHIVYQFLDFLELFGINNNSKNIQLIPPKSEEPGEYLTKLELTIFPEDLLIGINPFVGFQNRLRKWDKFSELIIKLLYMDNRIKIFLIGGPSDGSDVNDFVKINPERIHPVIGIDLKELTQLFKKLNIFISCDTGPIHLAAASGCFTIGLYGPTDPAVYGPFTHNKKVIYKKLKCSPCTTNKNGKKISCNENMCMMDIDVENVLEIVNNHIEAN
ncbi:putative glycosyltransferase [Methanococcus maripaludis KA1]|uniref:Putative glycosyltransferase n=1 Tax=Methanococcus maripaludis KA1 TaxID=637914 RepID=A0A2Z5PSY4_METMI|nr:glycosyltransferase family 9 protein [Methanococcus maripaludis]BAP60501.1 putative glycosyltransferase [Methanococcus maripaludis KA1]